MEAESKKTTNNTEETTTAGVVSLNGGLGGKRKYYYLMETDECVLCGRGGTTRTRVYGEKPDDFNKTHTFKQYACESHF